MEADTDGAIITILDEQSGLEERREAIQTLADASKQNSAIRERMAKPQILKALLQMIKYEETVPQVTFDSRNSALRCLGNACIDNDEARTFVASEGFEWAVPLLRLDVDFDLRKLAALVLYNICSDHEVAQKQAYNDGVHVELVDLLQDAGNKSDTMVELPRLVELFFWLSIHHGAALDKPSFHAHVFPTMLCLPMRFEFGSNDTETFAELVEALLGFLRDKEFQEQAIVNSLDHFIFEILERNELQICRAGSEADVKLLVPISASLTWVLSDLVALPSFLQWNPKAMGSELVSKAFTTIVTSVKGEDPHAGFDDARLANAACQVVGNYVFALTPAAYEWVVIETQLPVSILTLMTRVNNADFLHSATGLLKLLSRPSVAAREMIGAEPCAAAALEKLCHSDVRQLKEGGVKLIRALGRDCPSNQQRFAELARKAITALAAAPEQTQPETQPRNDTVDVT